MCFDYTKLPVDGVLTEMQKMNLSTEPAQIIGWITGGAAALIALLVAFGVDIDEEQKTAILGVVAIAAPIVAGILIRGKVFSPQMTQRIARRAAQTGDPSVTV